VFNGKQTFTKKKEVTDSKSTRFCQETPSEASRRSSIALEMPVFYEILLWVSKIRRLPLVHLLNQMAETDPLQRYLYGTTAPVTG
jgi:hypothetical protein